MTLAVSVPAGSFTLRFRTGTGPFTYSEPCGFKERSLTFAADTVDTDTPNCADPTLPGWMERSVSTRSASISGEGMFTKLAHDAAREWMLAGDSREVELTFAGNLAAGGGKYTGRMVLTSLGIGSPYRDKLTISVEAQSDGPLVWVPAA